MRPANPRPHALPVVQRMVRLIHAPSLAPHGLAVTGNPNGVFPLHAPNERGRQPGAAQRPGLIVSPSLGAGVQSSLGDSGEGPEARQLYTEGRR